jgi:feruloyl esterase
VAWVEKGIAPSQVLGQSAGPAAAPLSRPLCPYPQTANYAGKGDIHDAANWACGGNMESRGTVCPNVLVKYKDEADGPIDFAQSGVDREFCDADGRFADRDHDRDDLH